MGKQGFIINMNNNNERFPKEMLSRIVVMVFIACFSYLFCSSTVSAKALKLKFKKIADMPSSNIVIDPERYYGAQGTAFDTYTHKDGYAIAESRASGSKKLAIVHYRHTEDGIETVKKVIYTAAQIGHANDATIFKKGKQKYMFVARGGKGNKTACMIKLSDFNKGVAKVYKVSFSKLDTRSGTDLRGITYVGKKKILIGKKKVAKQVFVVEVGRRLNLVYLKQIKNNKASFVAVDSQRFNAPKIGSRECTAQGVTYHNGHLYIPFGDEGKGGKMRTGKIGRVGFNDLFGETNSNKAVSLPYVWSKTKAGEFVPEAVYFTTLEGKGQMYMNTNERNASRPDEYRDSLNRTVKKY